MVKKLSIVKGRYSEKDWIKDEIKNCKNACIQFHLTPH